MRHCEKCAREYFCSTIFETRQAIQQNLIHARSNRQSFASSQMLKYAVSGRRIDFTFSNMLRATEIVRRRRKLDFSPRFQMVRVVGGTANATNQIKWTIFWKSICFEFHLIVGCTLSIALCFVTQCIIIDNRRGHAIEIIPFNDAIFVYLWFAPSNSCDIRIVASNSLHSNSGCLTQTKTDVLSRYPLNSLESLLCACTVHSSSHWMRTYAALKKCTFW